MNTANLQLEGLLMAVAAINQALVYKGLLTTAELDRALAVSEQTVLGDDRVTLGTIVTNERGHEVYSITGDYLATFETLGAARKHLLKRRPKKDRKPS